MKKNKKKSKKRALSAVGNLDKKNIRIETGTFDSHVTTSSVRRLKPLDHQGDRFDVCYRYVVKNTKYQKQIIVQLPIMKIIKIKVKVMKKIKMKTRTRTRTAMKKNENENKNTKNKNHEKKKIIQINDNILKKHMSFVGRRAKS